MNAETILDQCPVVLLFVLTIAWFLIGCEAGFRLGRVAKARWPESGKLSAGPVVGAVLGLLAFLLAFTFSMSSTRFDARRQLVLDEAGAILVSYQRAQTLPEPQRATCIKLLRDYAALRLHLPQIQNIADLHAAITRSEGIQDALWAQVALLNNGPGAVVGGFTGSLTVLSDLQIKRVRAAVWNRIPAVIIGALFGIAFLALAALGFNSGLNERRPVIPAAVLSIAFSCVIVLIVDLERPHQRLFAVSQEPMADVVRRIQPSNP